ncbi:MAG: insulinase family protein [Chloroflexi bacterium]|nr:insulinase family protein [Chloroflexota bacterium]
MSFTLPITPETITRTVLDNGIVLLLKQNPHNPSISLRGRLRAGALYDTNATSGLANFSTIACARGTARRTFQDLNAEMDRSAMSLSFVAGMEMIGFGAKSLTADFDHLLDVMADVLMHPAYAEDEVVKLRRELVNGLEQANQNTQQVAYREFRSLCYPAFHPYHRLAEGRIESIQSLTRDALTEFHAHYFRPDMMTICLIGDILPEQAIDKMVHALGDWKATGVPSEHCIPDAPNPSTVIRHDSAIPGKTQVDLVLGSVGIRRTDPDYDALNLGDLIHGRLGLFGRLGAKVRDQQGLAYYVFSGVEVGLGPGPWTVRAGVNPQNLSRALESILAELRRLSTEPVMREELDDAYSFLTGSLALRLETNDGIAAMLSDIELYQLGLDYLQRYPTMLKAISAEQILAAVQARAMHENYVLSIAGPEN